MWKGRALFPKILAAEINCFEVVLLGRSCILNFPFRKCQPLLKKVENSLIIYTMSPGCESWAIYKHAYIIPLVLQDNWMFSFWSFTGSLVDYCLSGWQHWTTQHWSAPGKAGGVQTAGFLSPAIDHPQTNWHCSWHLQ